MNKLFFGDNLDIMREYIKEESVDLVYLDPPFNSRVTYNVLFDEKNGSESAAQITAFEDMWHWDQVAAETYHETVTQGPVKLAELLQLLRTFLGTNDMMAYLTMMAPRLVELRKALKKTGSIYLHCDPTASHYLKLVMDAVFGPKNYRNEITWKRTSAHNDPGRYGSNTDIIFFYTKGESWTWNQIYRPHDEKYKARFRNTDEDGRRWADDNLTAKGLSGGGYEYEYKGVKSLWRCPIETMERLDKEGRLHYTSKGGIRLKRYLNETAGTVLQVLWDDIPPINSQAAERLGYPTQKPEALLERIIKASSNKGDLVMDPFCGCGTTVAVAERLERQWIGIDITHLAIGLMRSRLETTFGPELSSYEVVGEPKDLESAQALKEHDPYQFEWWACGLVGARPAKDRKKGADRGIDGVLYFFDDNTNIAKKLVVQVKSGRITRNQIATLNHDREREGAEIGAFITLNVPTGPMKAEAANAGFYEPEYFPGKNYPRIQILTIRELLSGKQLQYPSLGVPGTYKRAQRQSKVEEPKQGNLLD